VSADGQSTDVFEHKVRRLEFDHKADEMVHERISWVVESAFADHAESLTGRAAEYNVHGTIADTGTVADILAVYVGYASADRGAAGKVKLVSRAMNGVVFDGGGHIETGLFETEAHPAGTGEEIDT
jgi:hypothetical protein